MRIKKCIKLSVIVLFIIAFGFRIQSDDKELFMGMNLGDSLVRPNVVILMDSSGSMNTIIFYPQKGLDGIVGTADDGFDPLIDYTGTVDGLNNSTNYIGETQWFARWIVDGNAEEFETFELEGINGENYWTGCYAGDGTPNNFQCGDNGTQYFQEGETVLFRDTVAPYFSAVAQISRKYEVDGNTWFELENIVGGPITVNGGHFQRSPYGDTWKPVVLQLYGTLDNNQEVRYPANYLRWAFIHASDEQQEAISHFSTWGTFDVTEQPPEELSNCATPGNNDLTAPNPRIRKLFTRIQTAREVICRVATTSNQIAKLGLFSFNYDNGANLEEGLSDMSDEASLLVAYKNNVWGIFGNAWTPLAEALADIWYYYKPGPASKTYWPVDYEIDNNLVNHSVSNPVTPVDYWCQKNYVVVMTDGESTKDGFDDWGKYGNSIFKQKSSKRNLPWETWDNGWGDPDNNDQDSGLPLNYDPETATYCPGYTCWTPPSGGTDYLDDVAYFLRHQDMFPDDFFGTDSETGWPGDQTIFTYTIGFAMDNDLLLQAAINGDGGYYKADNYQELIEAFQLVITSINLRNFAFSAITAPKKTATATNEELTVSYVGYFIPSQAAPIWEGHLLAFRLEDTWGFDADESGDLGPEEYIYETEEQCLNASVGQPCYRQVSLPIGHEWDAADKIPANRNLYTHNNSTSTFTFDLTNQDTLQPLFGADTTELEAEQTITKIRLPQFGDVFHADVGFIGPPPFGKIFIGNINPKGADDQKFSDFYTNNENRPRVLYTGTNDGILHMLHADGANAGAEIWGFIPDEVLPSLKTIAVDNQHTYTVDGRLSANDIYYIKPGESNNSWSTLMIFGLRRGGNAYYGMDITEVGSQPKILWKFKDDAHSGQSWGKAIIGRVRITDPANQSEVIDKWVAILTGGFEFNSENPTDQRGKAIFVVDAGTGELIWKIGYDAVNGAEDQENPEQQIVDVDTSDPRVHLTKSELFNYPIPSSLAAIDEDNDGYLDSLYFGNIGGHLFKTDIALPEVADWTTYVLYQSDITDKDSSIINTIEGGLITLTNKAFKVGDGIMGKTSYATGYVVNVAVKDITVITTSGEFQAGETVVCRNFDPIYLPPAVAFDSCYQLWITFGTGDRDRPRSSRQVGRFVAFRDNDATNTEATLQDISNGIYSAGDIIVTNPNGWYFNFRQDTGEKIFDPEPLILPDQNLIPHIYFNTYQPPPTASSLSPTDNPCSLPDEGIMTIYDISIKSCGVDEMSLAGAQTTGRIAGGGIYQSKEYVLYTSKSGNVADVPGGEGGQFTVEPKRLPQLGGILFWKEIRR